MSKQAIILAWLSVSDILVSALIHKQKQVFKHIKLLSRIAHSNKPQNRKYYKFMSITTTFADKSDGVNSIWETYKSTP